MSLLTRARNLANQVIADANGFGQAIVFTTPGGTVSKTVYGLAVKHSTAVDDIGAPIQGKTARVTVNEADLAAAGYPVRNADLTVNLKDHRVVWTDSSNTAYTYVITQIFPDRTLGIIRCILGDYRTGTEPKRIIGWKVCPIHVDLVASPNPSNTQTLDNGDVIAREYAPNVNGTLTIPYLTSVTGITVLTPLYVGENVYQDVPYSAGTFDNQRYGNFSVGERIAFNASLPIYQA